jgi:hypothetical protein
MGDPNTGSGLGGYLRWLVAFAVGFFPLLFALQVIPQGGDSRPNQTSFLMLGAVWAAVSIWFLVIMRPRRAITRWALIIAAFFGIITVYAGAAGI